MTTTGTDLPARHGDDAHGAIAGHLQSAIRKNFWRFLPVLTLAFIVNYLDRICIGFGALSMNHDLGITPLQFGLASGVLFVGYCLCEVPSNLVLYRVGARRWLARIMITWGLVAAANAFVSGPISLYIARFMLGVTEAGFFPGAAFLLSTWFPAQYRARALAWLSLAVPVSSVIGGPISGLLLQSAHGWLGLAGWQWMFIIEGLPACLLGFVILRLITDNPRDAHWLSVEEHRALISALDSEPKTEVRTSMKAALMDRRVLILTGVQFGFVLGSYGIALWLPQILRQYNLSIIAIGFLSTLPYLFAAVGMIAWARFADRSEGLLANLIGACAFAVIGLVLSVVDRALTPALIGLTIAMVGVTSARAIFWAIPAKFLSGAGAAGGLAFINSIGALGGFFGPFLMGWLRQVTGSFTAGILVMGGVLFASGLLALALASDASRDRKAPA
jgi:MFS transporter, ACS family, tartrate transporter